MKNYLASLGVRSSGGGSRKGKLPRIPKGLKKRARKKAAKIKHQKKVEERKKEIAALRKFVGS